MDKTEELIRIFFMACNKKDWSVLHKILSDHVSIDYSTLGFFSQKTEFIEVLEKQFIYDIQTTTLANTLAYHDSNQHIIITIAQHLNAYEEVPYFYPVIYGGKYVFIVDEVTNMITAISFMLEYQGENTAFIKEWNLKRNNIKYICNYDSMKQLNEIKGKDVYQQISYIIKLFYNCFDTHDFEIMRFLLNENAQLSREKTYSNGIIQGVAEHVEEYVNEVESYYAMSQHAIHIGEIKHIPSIGYVVEAQLLSPQRLNTKKLTFLNKYHSFYEEVITVILDENLKINSIDHKKMAEIHDNGFHVLEV